MADMDGRECLSCAQETRFTTWYPKLKPHVMKSRVVPLPDAFLEYLESDGMDLPTAPEGTSLCCGDPRMPRSSALLLSAQDTGDAEASSGSSISPTSTKYCFPDLEASLQALLDEFGDAYIKLEWTAPLDASWIMDNGMAKCSTTGHVFLLLKASDLVQHDVEMYKTLKSEIPAADMTPLHLVVRPWYSINRAGEFRCFVRRNNIVGISQRHTSDHFKHLDTQKERITETITNFFLSVVKPAVNLRSYVFDTYVDSKNRAWILDVSPVGSTTLPLLFEWKELYGVDCPSCEHHTEGVEERGSPQTASCEIRLMEEGAVRFQPLSVHRFPDDAVRWASETGQSLDMLLEHLAAQHEVGKLESASGGDYQ